jgi:hypothetical protein
LSRLLLGSVADKVVRGATVPVLIFRPDRAYAEAAAHESVGAAMATGATALSPPSLGGARVF